MPQAAQPKTGRRIAGGVAALALVAAGAWLLWPQSRQAVTPTAFLPPPEESSALVGRDGARTIAEVWRWPDTTEPATADTPAEPETARPFDEDAVAQALGNVVLDADGRIVLDRQALAALETAFNRLRGALDADDLAALQDIIRRRLPGIAGEETATIVGNYYLYRQALENFEKDQPSPAAGTDPDAEQARLQRLAALREEHFGPVVAAKFFAEEQAFSRYLLERHRLQADSSLSEQERSDRQAQLQQELEDGLLYLDEPTSPQAERLSAQLRRLREQGASEEYLHYVRSRGLGLATAAKLARSDAERQDWALRHARFEQEQRYILEAGLTEAERKAQLEALLERSFSPEELEAVRAYDRD